MPGRTAMQDVSDRLERGGVPVAGPFLDLVLPFLIQLLQACVKPKPTPTPQPASSTATPASWKKADEAQGFAEEHYDDGRASYDRWVLNRAAGDLMRKHRRENGERLRREDAVAIVSENLDQARFGDLERNALDLDRTQS